MNKPNRKKRISKAAWLDRALEILETEGMQGVRVDRMARDFGISRAGFYYHFRDRSDVLQKMLAHWGTEFTEVVVNDPGLSKLNPEKKLLRIMEMILDQDLTRYDLAIRDWSKRDKKAAKMVSKVYKLRVDFLRGIFRELGFRGQPLEMRTRLFVCVTIPGNMRCSRTCRKPKKESC